jgi:hypothetical protein
LCPKFAKIHLRPNIIEKWNIIEKIVYARTPFKRGERMSGYGRKRSILLFLSIHIEGGVKEPSIRLWLYGRHCVVPFPIVAFDQGPHIHMGPVYNARPVRIRRFADIHEETSAIVFSRKETFSKNLGQVAEKKLISSVIS